MTTVVLTWLLTGELDPQRGTRMAADPTLLDTLRQSTKAAGIPLVVIHDCLDEPDDDLTTFVRVHPGGNPYWVRWTHALSWVLAHRDVDWMWAVDGTDVELLHTPVMRPGTLYCGSEEHLVSHPDKGAWLAKGATPEVVDWLEAHPDLPILNMGTLGGDRRTMIEAMAALAARAGESDWEIGAFQQIGHELFAGRLVTGPMVHTRFGAEERTAAWWRHK